MKYLIKLNLRTAHQFQLRRLLQVRMMMNNKFKKDIEQLIFMSNKSEIMKIGNII